METKMIDSSEDLTVGNTTLSTPRAMKIGMVLKWGLDCWKYNIMHHSKSNGDGIGGRRCRFNCRTERGSWTRGFHKMIGFVNIFMQILWAGFGPGCREKRRLQVLPNVRRRVRLLGIHTNLCSENNSMVVTWMFMNKALKKLTHTHTGINVIQSIVYSRGSNLTRIYFSRFYMFVLEKDDEIIAAASIRYFFLFDSNLFDFFLVIEFVNTLCN
ncbi:Increased DNA methylation 1 [Glycine max]|nr:Increased DNA methylation 1 [Glycine max]